MPKTLAFIFAIALLIIGVVSFIPVLSAANANGQSLLSNTVFHGGHDHFAAVPSAAAGVSCSHTGPTHIVAIQNVQALPLATYAKLCDRLTFINQSHITREIAFGPHEDHVAYDGVAERVVGPNQSCTITLNQTGMFHYHDHSHDEVAGYFNVSK